MNSFDLTQRIEDSFDYEEHDHSESYAASLHVLKQPNYPEPLVFPLNEGENVIGRHHECNICIDNKVLSKKHAIIEIIDGDCTICDLGSANKTRKGKRILKPNVQYDLESGEDLYFGNLKVRFLKNVSKSDQGNSSDSEDQNDDIFDAPTQRLCLSPIDKVPQNYNISNVPSEQFSTVKNVSEPDFEGLDKDNTCFDAETQRFVQDDQDSTVETFKKPLDSNLSQAIKHSACHDGVASTSGVVLSTLARNSKNVSVPPCDLKLPENEMNANISLEESGKSSAIIILQRPVYTALSDDRQCKDDLNKSQYNTSTNHTQNVCHTFEDAQSFIQDKLVISSEDTDCEDYRVKSNDAQPVLPRDNSQRNPAISNVLLPGSPSVTSDVKCVDKSVLDKDSSPKHVSDEREVSTDEEALTQPCLSTKKLISSSEESDSENDSVPAVPTECEIKQTNALTDKKEQSFYNAPVQPSCDIAPTSVSCKGSSDKHLADKDVSTDEEESIYIAPDQSKKILSSSDESDIENEVTTSVELSESAVATSIKLPKINDKEIVSQKFESKQENVETDEEGVSIADAAQCLSKTKQIISNENDVKNEDTPVVDSSPVPCKAAADLDKTAPEDHLTNECNDSTDDEHLLYKVSTQLCIENREILSERTVEDETALQSLTSLVDKASKTKSGENISGKHESWKDGLEGGEEYLSDASTQPFFDKKQTTSDEKDAKNDASVAGPSTSHCKTTADIDELMLDKTVSEDQSTDDDGLLHKALTQPYLQRKGIISPADESDADQGESAIMKDAKKCKSEISDVKTSEDKSTSVLSPACESEEKLSMRINNDDTGAINGNACKSTMDVIVSRKYSTDDKTTDDEDSLCEAPTQPYFQNKGIISSSDENEMENNKIVVSTKCRGQKTLPTDEQGNAPKLPTSQISQKGTTNENDVSTDEDSLCEAPTQAYVQSKKLVSSSDDSDSDIESNKTAFKPSMPVPAVSNKEANKIIPENYEPGEDDASTDGGEDFSNAPTQPFHQNKEQTLFKERATDCAHLSKDKTDGLAVRNSRSSQNEQILLNARHYHQSENLPDEIFVLDSQSELKEHVNEPVEETQMCIQDSMFDFGNDTLNDTDAKKVPEMTNCKILQNILLGGEQEAVDNPNMVLEAETQPCELTEFSAETVEETQPLTCIPDSLWFDEVSLQKVPACKNASAVKNRKKTEMESSLANKAMTARKDEINAMTQSVITDQMYSEKSEPPMQDHAFSTPEMKTSYKDKANPIWKNLESVSPITLGKQHLSVESTTMLKNDINEPEANTLLSSIDSTEETLKALSSKSASLIDDTLKASPQESRISMIDAMMSPKQNTIVDGSEGGKKRARENSTGSQFENKNELTNLNTAKKQTINSVSDVIKVDLCGGADNSTVENTESMEADNPVAKTSEKLVSETGSSMSISVDSGSSFERTENLRSADDIEPLKETGETGSSRSVSMNLVNPNEILRSAEDDKALTETNEREVGENGCTNSVSTNAVDSHESIGNVRSADGKPKREINVKSEINEDTADSQESADPVQDSSESLTLKHKNVGRKKSRRKILRRLGVRRRNPVPIETTSEEENLESAKLSNQISSAKLKDETRGIDLLESKVSTRLSKLGASCQIEDQEQSDVSNKKQTIADSKCLQAPKTVLKRKGKKWMVNSGADGDSSVPDDFIPNDRKKTRRHQSNTKTSEATCEPISNDELNTSDTKFTAEKKIETKENFEHCADDLEKESTACTENTVKTFKRNKRRTSKTNKESPEANQPVSSKLRKRQSASMSTDGTARHVEIEKIGQSNADAEISVEIQVPIIGSKRKSTSKKSAPEKAIEKTDDVVAANLQTEAKHSARQTSKRKGAKEDANKSTPTKCSRDSSVSRIGSSEESIMSPKKRKLAATKNFKFCFTGITSEDFKKIITNLNATVVEDTLCCTHLISDKFYRTMKTLCCTAKGIPVVSNQWLYDSAKNKAFLDHTPYVIADKDAEKQHNFSLRETLEKSAENPLLQGWSIHVTSKVVPPPENMKEIIQAAGGKYLPRKPSKFSDKTVIVSCPQDAPQLANAFKSGIPIVGAEFLLTGILRYQIDVDSYQLDLKETKEDVPKKRRRK